MIVSKVYRDNGRHITRADYQDEPVHLGSENVLFPKVNSLQARALRRLIPTGVTLSHRDFDGETRTYRLGSFIGSLRDKGWPVVNHDEIVITGDLVPRKAIYTRYEIFAIFTDELKSRIDLICEAVDRLEAEATARQ